MRIDGGGVDGELLYHASCRRQVLEQPSPDALRAPSRVAVVDGRHRPELGRAIGPAASRLQHEENAADHPTIIDAMRARAVLGKMRLDCRPRLIAQPFGLSHDSLESRFTPYR